MKLFKSWFLPATCTIILVVTTYATSTEAAKQKQAEVNLQQQRQQRQQHQQFDVATATDVVPMRPLKYGEKTTRKIPNNELLLLPTTPQTIKKNYTNVEIASRKGLRSRKEYIELPTNRPTTQISTQNQLVVQQHDIPIVQKSRELSSKQITQTVGQHNQQQQQRQRIQQNINRSRSQSPITTPTNHQQQQLRLQPTQLSNLNFDSEKTVAKTKTTSTTTKTTTAIATQTKYHQHSFNETTTSPRNIGSIVSTKPNINHPPQLYRNANSSSSSSLLTHHQNRNNLNNSSNHNNNNNRHNIAFETNSSKNARAPRPPFQFPNNFNFNIFSPEFWQFLSPTTSSAPPPPTTRTTTSTTKKPPKKYRPPTQISTKEEKLNLVKPKQNIPSRTTSTTTTKKPEPSIQSNNKNNIVPPKRDDGPFRIALPTFNLLSSRRETYDDSEKGKRNVEGDTSLRERFDCPRESEVRFQLFPKICKIDEDCKVWNREEICCDIFGAKSCVTGIPKPLEETSHEPILGVIPRKCPNRPLAELWWEVKECETDMDCWPRVCCPDGRRRYCRTSQPELSTVPVPVKRSFNYLSEYLECTPPPPPIFDLHPKTCTSTLDCFPNVCCQEEGLRHCRPPKKSVLTMLANVFNVDFVKRLTQNIVIK